MIDQSHPYYQLACQMYPKVVNNLLAQQRITQMEANFIMSKVSGPEFSQFVQNAIASLPSIQGEQHMEKLIYDNLIGPMVQYIRQQAAYQQGGYGGGMIVNPGAPGYRPMMGAGGFAPRGGFAPGGGSSWYSGNRGAVAPAFQRGPMAGSYHPETITPAPRGRTSDKTVKAPEPKEKPKWAEPGLDQTKTVNHTLNNTGFSLQEFLSSDGSPITEAYVIDDRPRYLSPTEAVNAFKGLLPSEDNVKKFLTVCYRQLKVLKNVDRNAFKNLIKAVVGPVTNISDDRVGDRLKAIMTVSGDHPSGAVNAFHKMIVDEFNEHVLSGELIDSTPSHYLEWKLSASSLSGIYDLVTGNMDKNTRDALHQIKDFDQALKSVVQKVLDTVVINGTVTRILDPISDPSVMDIYSRAIPPIWKNDVSGTWEATDNFFAKYLAAQKTINGSKTTTATTVEQQLSSKLHLVDRNFAVIQVPRIITWCNQPVSDAASWSSDGKIVSCCYDNGSVNNDTAYFLMRAITRTKASNANNFALVPYGLICEVQDGAISLNYGNTTDGKLWVGSRRYY